MLNNTYFKIDDPAGHDDTDTGKYLCCLVQK